MSDHAGLHEREHGAGDDLPRPRGPRGGTGPHGTA